MMSMGENKAIEFANKNKLAAILIIKHADNNFEYIFSDAAQNLTGE